MQEPLRTPIWHRNIQWEGACAVCFATGSFPLLFEIDSVIPPYPRLFFAKCPHCATVFQLNFDQPNYASSEAMNGPSLRYYVEQGAALEILALPAMIAAKLKSSPEHGAVRTYLEVGCGFGFGIDFAARSFGWTARGIDPSPFAEHGRRILGIDIRTEYLTKGNANSQGKQDVIAALEVIEHIVKPYDFIDTLKFNLNDDALLIVTTPDGELLDPDKTIPTFVSLTSPGYHAILYNRESLQHLLTGAGFSDVQVVKRGAGLLAVAGAGATKIDLDQSFDANLYAEYLKKKLEYLRSQPRIRSPNASVPKVDELKDRAMLETGLAYRLFKHLVNQGNYREAEFVLSGLSDIVRRRHGIEILDSAAMIALLHRNWDFEQFPVCVSGILFFSAYIRLNHHKDRPSAVVLFSAAQSAAKRQREIMQSLGYDDGELADIEAVAFHELALVHRSMFGLKFYLEQGANLEKLMLPAMIANRWAEKVGRKGARNYLEVGCELGFGIDLAARCFGWQARGIDPSPFGQEGRKLLSVDIQPEYLTRDHATSQGKQDVIAALEVIERVIEPHDFIDTLKFSLTDDALLIVTTRDGDAIQIDQAMPTSLNVVTPGYHAILYTRESLQWLLESAGFSEIQVVARGATLLAVAGPGAAQIDLDHAFDADLYARYLEKKLDDLRNQPSIRSPKESGPDAAALKDRATLETGFAYRLFKHLVNQGRYPEAELTLYGLADIARRRHGIEILDTAAIIALLDQDWDFESLTERIPVCLTGVLFFSAYIRLNYYEDRAGAAALFSAAQFAAKRQREIMQNAGYDDGEIANIEAVATRELALVTRWMSGGS